MLISIAVTNFLSFKHRTEMSFVRPNKAQKKAPQGWPHPEISTVSAIYGANASGKSNLISVFNVISELFGATTDEPRVPSRFAGSDHGSEDSGSTFEVEFIAERIEYRYTVKFGNGQIDFELLEAYYSSRATPLFRRTPGPDDTIEVKFSPKLTGPKKSVVDLTNPKQLLLSRFNELKNNPLRAPYEGLVESIHVIDGHHLTNASEGLIAQIDHLSEESQEQAKEFLRQADVGIEDVQVEKRSKEELKSLREAMSKFLDGDDLDEAVERQSHRVTFDHRGEEGLFSLPLGAESTGTRAMLCFIMLAIQALKSGATLVIDEIDSSLHPLLLREAIDLFKNPTTNPSQAQLVYSTHDISLLDEAPLQNALLDPDQIWFVDKDNSGISSIYSLEDFEGIRAETNVYRRYLLGQFGGVPNVGELAGAIVSRDKTDTPS
ncbi:ATP-binding protein [Brevibacterium sediminis]|uniref:AAA family ATPase n=1 Tax=Brevibacterium sediminis TaxID=1857024 RepID=UPI002174DF7F|nr:ATP-binding protein [Brevibacterium sediminis]MCS4593321.1 ATP-binding protein [Brevibacterium sediminis]